MGKLNIIRRKISDNVLVNVSEKYILPKAIILKSFGFAQCCCYWIKG